VNIMIWDEIDSGHDFLAYTRVSNLLHGGGATEYFQNTEVSVKLMPRKSAAPQVRPRDPNSGVPQTLCHPVTLCRVLLHVAAFILCLTKCTCVRCSHAVTLTIAVSAASHSVLFSVM
jgi:hypothetical protein